MAVFALWFWVVHPVEGTVTTTSYLGFHSTNFPHDATQLSLTESQVRPTQPRRDYSE